MEIFGENKKRSSYLKNARAIFWPGYRVSQINSLTVRERAKKHENKSNRRRILHNHCILSLHDTYISIRNLILFPIIYRNLSETVRKRTNRTISRCDLEQPSLIQSLGDLKVRDVHIHFIYLLP